MKYLIYLLIASVFLGTEILSIPLLGFQLSVYRLLVIVTSLTFLTKIIISDPDLEFSISDRLNQYQLVYIIWLIYGILSIFWVESYSRWAFGVFFLGVGTLSIIFITFFVKEREEIINVIYIFFFMSVFQQILGWYEVITGNFLWGYNRFGAPMTTFGNINDYATLVLAGIFFGLIIFLLTKDTFLKLYSIIHIVSGILLIMRSGSRGNQLALIVGIFTLIIINILTSKYARKIFYTLLVLFFFYVVLFVLLPFVREFTYTVIDFINTNFFRVGGSNRYRVNLILNGFAFLIQTYGLGVGAGNIEYWLSNRPVFADIDAINMHNWFMEILTGYGIIIFLLYVVMYIYIIRRLYINYRYSNDQFIKRSSLVLLAYVIAFVVSSISSASNIFIEWQWVMWGIIISFTAYSERKLARQAA